jgi:hypothetical protein
MRVAPLTPRVCRRDTVITRSILSRLFERIERRDSMERVMKLPARGPLDPGGFESTPRDGPGKAIEI